MQRYRVRVNQKDLEVNLLSRTQNSLSFSVDGESYTVEISPILEQRSNQAAKAFVSAPVLSSQKTHLPGEVVAPMPGIIVHIPIKVGQSVEIGQTIIVIEAMKMENNISANKAGKIKDIHVKVGQEVENNKLLISIE